MKQLIKTLLILPIWIFLILFNSLYAGQVGPEEVYQKYREALTLSDPYSINQFFSARTLAAKQKYIEGLKAEGKTESEIQALLLEGGKRRFKYETSRKQINVIESNGKATIIFEVIDENIPNYFGDDPTIKTIPVSETIEEVHFVYENGWKIDNTVIAPKKKKKSKMNKEEGVTLLTCDIVEIKKEVEQIMAMRGVSTVVFYLPENGCQYYNKVFKQEYFIKQFKVEYNDQREHQYIFFGKRNDQTKLRNIFSADGLSLLRFLENRD